MSKQRSILFTIDSPGGGGDRPPMVALALGLQVRGHQVTMLCGAACEPQVRAAGLSVITIPAPFDQASYFSPTTIPDWVAAFQGAGDTADDSAANPIVAWAQSALATSVELVSDIKPDLIVSSLFCMGLGDALARELSIPWCFVNPSFYFGDPLSDTWEADWYGEGTRLFMEHCFLPVSQRADMVLHATDHEFDSVATPLPSNHHHVGFLLWEPQMEVPPFVTEEGDPWVLITTSSVPQPGEFTMVQAALEALADQPVRVLLTLPNRDPNVLGNIPNNATIVDYVPHTPVIRRSTLVVSHAGHGIVSKALYYGVPMVLLPWDRDQPGVALRAENLGVAKVVQREDVTPESVRQAVETVLNEPIYRKTAGNVSSRLKAMDSVEGACALLEQVR